MSAVVLSAPARPVLDLRELMLSVGSHESPERGRCVMEAVSVVAGEPWSDRPECVSPVISRFLRRWNDTLAWRPRQALKRYICPVIGTRTTDADEERRVALVCDWLIRECAPAWLRLAGLREEADELAGGPPMGPATIAAFRPVLWEIRLATKVRIRPDCFEQRFVRRVARDSAWDAAVATLVPEPWDGICGADRALVLDVVLNALAAASGERVWPTATALRASAHGLVERLCVVGQSERERWSA